MNSQDAFEIKAKLINRTAGHEFVVHVGPEVARRLKRGDWVKLLGEMVWIVDLQPVQGDSFAATEFAVTVRTDNVHQDS